MATRSSGDPTTSVLLAITSSLKGFDLIGHDVVVVAMLGSI